MQQMEALQQQLQQRESDWLEVRHQLEELIRENSELRKKRRVTPQCRPVAGRCTAQTHKGQSEVNIHMLFFSSGHESLESYQHLPSISS